MVLKRIDLEPLERCTDDK